MIRNEDLTRVKAIAQEVIALCDAALKEAGDIQRSNLGTLRRVVPTPDHPGGTRTSAALRRRTLDLTVALAMLRNPNTKRR